MGDLLDQQLEVLLSCLGEATQLMKTTFNLLQKKLKVLVDLNNFNGQYGAISFVKMVEFSNNTKQFVEKTAILSASDKDKMAAEMVAALSGRDDFKTFNDQGDALNWLE